MTRFKSKLLSTNSERERRGEKGLKVYSPANCDEIKIPFKREKFAKVVGKLAQIPPRKLLGSSEDDSDQLSTDDSRIISGVLVQNGFNLTLMAPEDLKEYAGLTTTSINFKKRLFCSAGIDLIRWGLEGMFGSIKQLSPSSSTTNGTTNGKTPTKADSDETTRLLVMDSVTVDVSATGEVCLSWEGNMMNDSIADSVLSVLVQMETGMVGVKRKSPFTLMPLFSDLTPLLHRFRLRIPTSASPTPQSHPQPTHIRFYASPKALPPPSPP
jgi:cleavage and polyadenylation specificity factor subunit 3